MVDTYDFSFQKIH